MTAGLRKELPFGLTGIPVLVAVAGCALAGVAGANEVADAASRGWSCALCPAPGGWKGEVDAGVGWVSDASARFGDYRGLDRQGGFAALDGTGRYRGDGGRFADLRATDLGIDSRSLELRAGVRGRYVVALDYREIPKYRGFGASTAYLGAGANRLALPGDWQPAATTDRMTGLAQSLTPAALEIRRKTAALAVRGWLGSGWSFDLGLQHQGKEGTRPFGAGVFTIHSSHFPAPVDFATNSLEAGLSYAGEAIGWRLGLSESEFDNGYQSITWPNPFTPIPGTEILRAALEPDNRFRQAEFTGAWTASRKLRFSATAAVGRMEQDEPLLPASSNPDYAEVPVPRPTANTRIDLGTLNLAGTAVLRLSPRFALTARLRRDERDNRTPVDLFTPIITDIAPREPRPNRPYSLQRDRASLALRYRPHRAARLRAGVDREDNERTLQSVLDTEELAYWGEVSLQLGSRAEARVRMDRFDRDAGPYVQLDDGGPVEHPLMRKFHLADRERERLKLDLDLFPLPELTLGLSFSSSTDEYRRSVIGLREADDRVLSLDVSWSTGEQLRVHGFASHDRIDSLAVSAPGAAALHWTGATRDRFFTAAAGFQFRPVARARAGFDLVWAESKGDISTVSGNSGGAFPTLATELWNARLYLEYAVKANWVFKARLEYESFDSSDWALDGIGPDGIPAILGFGQDSGGYDVVVLRLQAAYRF